MPHARSIASALRLVAVWLLAMSVLLGPARLGGVLGFAAPLGGCGTACPCDDGLDPVRAETRGESAEVAPDERVDVGSEDRGTAPCRDECPDDCPNCGCALGAAMAVLPVAEASSAVPWALVAMFSPVAAPASGAPYGVFRPPRARA